MIGVDANLLLRLILQDDPVQAKEVRSAVAAALNRGEDLVIGPIAFVETVWTLQGARKIGKAALIEAVEALIATPPFRVFDEAAVRQALALYREGRAGLSDCLIRAMDHAAGCRLTLTFDRKALDLPGFAHPAAA